jgi:hypothetical protein
MWKLCPERKDTSKATVSIHSFGCKDFGRFADTIVNAQKTFIAGYKAAQSAIQIDHDANHQAKQKREFNLKFEQTNEME